MIPEHGADGVSHHQVVEERHHRLRGLHEPQPGNRCSHGRPLQSANAQGTRCASCSPIATGLRLGGHGSCIGTAASLQAYGCRSGTAAAATAAAGRAAARSMLSSSQVREVHVVQGQGVQRGG